MKGVHKECYGSSPNHSNLNVELELEDALEVDAESRSPVNPELNKRLPRLAKRIASEKLDGSSRSPAKLSSMHSMPRGGIQHHHTTLEGKGRRPAGLQPLKTPPTDLDYSEQRSFLQSPSGPVAPDSVRGPTKRFSIRDSSLMLPPTTELGPELEALRSQDIQHDANSAAERALQALNQKKGGDGAYPSTPGVASPSTASTATPATVDTLADNGVTSPSKLRRRSSLRRREGVHGAKGTGRKVEGREIQQDHAQYALTYGMMLGIRVMTGRRDQDLQRISSEQKAKDAAMRSESSNTLDASSPPRKSDSYNHLDHADMAQSAKDRLEGRLLVDEDFDSTLELNFDPAGSSGPPLPTPPHKLTFSFKFKDYMWNVFRVIRALSGIDEAEYMLSLAGDFNYIEFIANSKSGQFFFYSHDGHYMIKTQTKEECGLLRKIMPRYVHHLTRNPNSLLVRFYGMHRVKFKTQIIYFVIMSSVFNTEKDIHIKFDLKGSTKGRETSEEECRNGSVQKDMNLMRSGRKFRLGEERIDMFVQTLRADAYFLRDLNVMDYSLLVGVHDANRGSDNRRRSSGVVLTRDSQQRASLIQQQRASMRLRDHDQMDFSTPARHSSKQLAPHTWDSVSTIESAAQTVADAGVNENAASIFQSYFGGISSAEDTREIYFLGIIDILQLYNMNKRAESAMKGMFTDKNTLSAVNPEAYAQRMVNFILAHTDYEDILEQRRRRMNLPTAINVDASAKNVDSTDKEGKRGKITSIFSFGKSKMKKKKGSDVVGSSPGPTSPADSKTGDAKVDML